MYRFIYGIFNDTFNNSDYTALKDRMMNQYSLRKNVEGSDCSLISGAILAFALND
jgi:hypothetical protein